MNRSTARSMVGRYTREGKIQERLRGGRNNVRVDKEMRNCLREIINDNFLLTLWQINRQLRRRLPFIHDRTVARTLDRMLFRVQLARPLPAERSRLNVLEKRTAYANWFMNRGVVPHSVFVDEYGYNICTSRNQGIGTRNVTVAIAILPINGLVFHSAIIGGMNAKRFSDFLMQARLNLDPDELVVFIYDGAPAHRRPNHSGPNTELNMLPP